MLPTFPQEKVKTQIYRYWGCCAAHIDQVDISVFSEDVCTRWCSERIELSPSEHTKLLGADYYGAIRTERESFSTSHSGCHTPQAAGTVRHSAISWLQISNDAFFSVYQEGAFYKRHADNAKSDFVAYSNLWVCRPSSSSADDNGRSVTVIYFLGTQQSNDVCDEVAAKTRRFSQSDCRPLRE